MALGALPDELCRHVALFLPAPDVLRFLTINHSLAIFGRSDFLWRYLLERDDRDGKHSFNADSTGETQKRAYLTYAHTAELSAVQWCHASARVRGEPDAREGHNMCILGSPSNRKVLLTGGFCDDDSIHLLPVSSEEQRWTTVHPTSRAPFVYGASLTALDEQRAVRFGGFRAGGYSSETNQVFVLTLTQNEDGQDIVHWEEKTISGSSATARAYHSATLVRDRYLVIIGGMTTRGSMLQVAILDTQTWTWVAQNISDLDGNTKPSGRHGHSVVLDSRRNRLVLFGGGSGSDLLRSGVDNTEVWQLEMGINKDLERPWNWRQIYRNENNESDNETEDADEVLASGLTPAETLVFGRCHIGLRVTVDKVLLAFGSAHPATNGVLAYDLSTDEFHRPEIRGPLPVPRFTAAAVVLDKEGWVIAHGGYTTQSHGTLGDTVVLDLAPSMKRVFPALQTGVQGNAGVVSYREIGDADVHRSRASRADNTIGAMLLALSASWHEDRSISAIHMLSDFIIGGGMANEQANIRDGDDHDNGRDDDDADDSISSNL